MVRTQKFGREAQIGSDMETSMTSAPPREPQLDSALPLIVGSRLRRLRTICSAPGCLISWTLSPPFDGTGTVARAEQEGAGAVAQDKTLRRIRPDPARPHGEVTVRRVASLGSVSACVPCQPSAGKQGRCLATLHLLLLLISCESTVTY